MAAQAQAQKMQLIKGERHLFSSSDDNVVMKQILATHSPDGRDVDVRPILNVIEDILKRATPTPTTVVVPQTTPLLDVVEDKTHHEAVAGMLEALAFTIHRISCEISCKCTGGGDAHATTVALFNLLSSYSWDAKLVLSLAAFAMSYGEFSLTAQLHAVNPLAKSVSLLKQLPDVLEHTDMLRPRFEALNTLIRAMVDVTKCIIPFKELPTDHIDTPAMSAALAHIPTAVYWTIRSVVACASQIVGLIGLGHEHISATTEAWELSSLAHKVTNIHEHLTKQLSICHQYLEERRQVETYQTLVRLFEMVHIDNLRILKALLYAKDDLPLIDGTTRRKVSVEPLRRKIVIFFISELDVSHDEVFILSQIYNEPHQGKMDRHYEVVWLPIVDRGVVWDATKQATFERISTTMPWYSFHNPTLLEPAVIRYAREMWHFEKKPMLVVLDAQGRLVCPNAFYMIWIWGSLAFPFTSLREEALWKEETWRLEFLADEIDPMLLTWVREGRFICLYGGEDLDWIRRFTAVMKRVAQEARIPLEMLYVGKSNPKERIKRVTNTIAAEGLSNYWNDPVMMWFFWVRLESMLHSKMQHGRNIENDGIMQEVMNMLSFDGSDEGWALISHGSTDMVKSPGKKLLECLTDFATWKEKVEHEGFISALVNALQPYHTDEHCTRLILPGTTGKIHEKVICAECKRPMEKYILYRCCND